jgi:hypothetical protein
MNLIVVDDTLHIELTWVDRLLACRLRGRLLVPLDHVVGASAAEPPRGWALRAPGTNVPGLVKFGTYYTRGGREFWLYTPRAKGRRALVLELRDEPYRRLVLSVDDCREWAERLDPTRQRPAYSDLNLRAGAPWLPRAGPEANVRPRASGAFSSRPPLPKHSPYAARTRPAIEPAWRRRAGGVSFPPPESAARRGLAFAEPKPSAGRKEAEGR